MERKLLNELDTEKTEADLENNKIACNESKD